MGIGIKVVFYTLLVCFCLSELTLEEYQELQRQTPEILFQTRSENDQRQYTPNIQKLIFTTPWNPRGSDLVIKYAKKFDYVSPCWYDLSFSSDHILIENDKLYNETFVKLLREANPDVKILPRVYVAGNQQGLLQSIGSFQSKFKQAIGLIVTIVEKQNFDGLVWDTPFNTLMAGEKYLGIRNLIVQFVNSIRMNLMNDRLVFFNMANPMAMDLAVDMYAILKVDCILIQNYDNNSYMPMITKSIQWSKSLKMNHKTSFMLMLPFFSRRQGQGIDTLEIERALKNEGQLGAAIDQDMCTFFQYRTRAQSYTPCYHYFKKVFQRIESEGLKMGFWEAGNGVQNYYQFL